MPERRIGFIPKAVEINEICGVFVTDQRTIKVAESAPVSPKEELRALFGKPAQGAKESRPTIDFSKVDIDYLASLEGNTSVRHTSIEKLAIGKGIGGYGIWMSYRADDEKTNHLVLDLVPPKELVRKRKEEGLSAKETRRRYAMRCQEVYRRALPPIIAEKVDWKI